MSSPEQNKELVRRFFEIAFIKHELAEAVGLLSQDYVLHDPARPRFSGGPAGWEKHQKLYIDAIPDHRCDVVRQLVDGDYVTTEWTATGTQSRDLEGIFPKNRHVSIEGITISRVANDRIAEQWQVWDQLGFFEQLGIVTVPPQFQTPAEG